ncbi:MAG: hypothetical protein KGJ58_00095 [Patescibacteria group bacterium]|nr:hypothetical protein [Patescibacteria group bacterium]MDE2217844.1 hypothetical protein [Patescibacteria group bacterium]
MNLDEIVSAMEENSKNVKMFLEKYKDICFAIVANDGSVSLSENLEKFSLFKELDEKQRGESCIILDNTIVNFSRYFRVERIEFFFKIDLKFGSNLFGLSSFVNIPFTNIQGNTSMANLFQIPLGYLTLFPLKQHILGQKSFKLTLTLKECALIPYPQQIKTKEFLLW